MCRQNSSSHLIHLKYSGGNFSVTPCASLSTAATKGNGLKAVSPADSTKLETVLVKNNEVNGAEDSAVPGVDALIHLASPLLGKGNARTMKGII